MVSPAWDPLSSDPNLINMLISYLRIFWTSQVSTQIIMIGSRIATQIGRSIWFVPFLGSNYTGCWAQVSLNQQWMIVLRTRRLIIYSFSGFESQGVLQTKTIRLEHVRSWSWLLGVHDISSWFRSDPNIHNHVYVTCRREDVSYQMCCFDMFLPLELVDHVGSDVSSELSRFDT